MQEEAVCLVERLRLLVCLLVLVLCQSLDLWVGVVLVCLVDLRSCFGCCFGI